MEESMQSLQRGIERRQQELHNVAQSIARSAARLTRQANAVKVLTISLGAITAAKGTFDTVIGGNSSFNLIFFTAIGIVISVCGGIEAAFKFEKRGTALTELAAACHAMVRWVDTEWRNHIGSNYGTDQRDAARRLITAADDKLSKAQEEAAKLGLNITLEVYELDGDEYRNAVAA